MIKKRVAIVGTGGTISSRGEHPLQLIEYVNKADILTTSEVVDATPMLAEVVEPVVVPYAALPSPDIGPNDWLALARAINHIPQQHKNIAGIVVTHGTSTLEETAWFLNLTLKLSMPVVLVGAQRPQTGLSTDAQLNLVNAARVAASESARDLGVLVCLNDEIQAARDVTKSSTYRVQTFKSPDFGQLGQVDHDGVFIYRRPTRICAPHTEFDVARIEQLARVDIALAYAGADGTAIDAFAAAGAKAIVSASFAPGIPTRSMQAALQRAADSGIVIVESSRSGSGRVTPIVTRQASPSISADNLTPQKARILTMLGLSVTDDIDQLRSMFSRY